jgi:branched-chain amino acid transport system ATP-binding protein
VINQALPILSVNNLSAGYGKIDVLHNITFNLREGECVAVIGANGAGKTTLLKSIAGLISIKRGEVIFLEQNLTSLPPNWRPKLGLALVPEGRQIFSNLTVKENLEIGGYLRQDKKGCKEDLDYYLELFPILKERSTQNGGTLSGGEQQMLAIARALMSKPKLLLLDEPSMGIAPIFVEKVFSTLSDLKQKGLTILLVEQNVQHALKLADRIEVLELGKVVLNGTSSEIANNQTIKNLYLS